MFDDPITPEAQELYDSICKVFLASGDLFTVPPFIFKNIFTKKWKELIRLNDKIFAYGDAIIDEKRKNIEKKLQGITDGNNQIDSRTDFLSYVMATRKLSEREANVAIVELLFGGVDTVQ